MVSLSEQTPLPGRKQNQRGHFHQLRTRPSSSFSPSLPPRLPQSCALGWEVTCAKRHVLLGTRRGRRKAPGARGCWARLFASEVLLASSRSPTLTLCCREEPLPTGTLTGLQCEGSRYLDRAGGPCANGQRSFAPSRPSVSIIVTQKRQLTVFILDHPHRDVPLGLISFVEVQGLSRVGKTSEPEDQHGSGCDMHEDQHGSRQADLRARLVPTLRWIAKCFR